MRIFRSSAISAWIFPDAIFRIRTTEKLLYLTFDDGPDPDSTCQLLDILGKYNIKALFFCDGRAAEEYPDLIDKIKSNGHLIGNHGYNHLNGWFTNLKDYIGDTEKAAPYTSSNLFRPPYGRLRPDQYRKLKETYKIFFWDLMPYDFDIRLGSNISFDILKRKMRNGSIIVLHDTPQSSAISILDRFIDYSISCGYRFALPV
jgi:peptidoglycan-N-acetylglucosamine deacetylase